MCSTAPSHQAVGEAQPASSTTAPDRCCSPSFELGRTPPPMSPGATGQGVLLARSDDPDYDLSCTPVCRWGDYSGASPDPRSPSLVWGRGAADRQTGRPAAELGNADGCARRLGSLMALPLVAAVFLARDRKDELRESLCRMLTQSGYPPDRVE